MADSQQTDVTTEQVRKDAFSTDHLLGDLKHRSVRGGTVTLVAQAVRFALQLGSTMILARLLVPEDFGLIAMVLAVTGLVGMFKDAGLSMVTVQRPDISHAQVSTLLWINVALGIFVMFVVAAVSPGLAWFYDEPRLIPIGIVLSTTFVFGGLTVQHQALLRRQMRFGALAKIEVASMVTGVAVALTMAVAGLGYWALVGSIYGGVVANATLVWLACEWRPGRPHRRCGIRSMLGFGGDLLGFNMLNYLKRNADNVLIGAVVGAAALGLYSKAYSLLMLPIKQINAPLTGVALPMLSRLAGDDRRFVSGYRSALGAVAIASVPVPIFLAIAATPAIQTLLGDKWLGAVDIFRALAIAAAIDALNVATGWVYISLGHTRRQLYWGIVQTLVFLTAFAVGVRWGAVGVAVAYSATLLVLRLPALLVCYSRTPLRLRDFLSAVWPAFAASAVAGSASALVMRQLPDTMLPVVTLLVAAVPFAALYLACVGLTSPGRSLMTSVLAVRRRMTVSIPKYS